MDSVDAGHLIYLVVLLSAVLFYYVVANRRALGKMARHAVLWALIFIGVLAAVGLWEDVRPRLAPMQISHGDGVIEIERDPSGHYLAMVSLNGQPIEFLVDTGASNVVLSEEDAKKAGIDLESLTYTGRAQTANGIVRTAAVRIDTLDIGGISDRDVKAYVTDGALFGSLLGMDYLSRFQKIEIHRGKLILTR